MRGRHRIELDRLGQRGAVQFGIVIGGAVKADHLGQELAGLGAGGHLVHHPGVAQGELHLGLVDDLPQLLGAQQRHGVDHHRTGLGRRQPAGHQRRIVGRTDQHPVARLQPEILDQRMRHPVGPVGQFLIGAHPPAADKRGPVTEPVFHHPVGQFDRRVQGLGIVDPVQQQLGPQLGRRQVVPGKCVGVRGRVELRIRHGGPPVVWPGAIRAGQDQPSTTAKCFKLKVLSLQ